MKTQIVSHAQGTEAWHKHRAQHLNASECSAVMGLSSYKTRTQLLHEKATGFAKEVDAATHHRFAKGHEFEATARPWAEEIIGSELFPVVLACEYEGLNLSASLDGVDMASEITFEHKTGRADLLSSLDRGEIPDEYHPQMEMGLMLSGAGKCLFMASSGNKEAMRFAWYTPNLELRAQIIAAWHQFRADLAAYVPQEVIIPSVATPQIGLPAVSITVNGSIALVDNLDKFGAALNSYIEKLNRKPETDTDFANLEDAVKRLKAAEDQLDAAESNALAQTDSIDAMRRTVALHRDTARTTRLLIDKLVKAEKENRRTKIIGDAVAELHIHIKALNERTRNFMPVIQSQFQEVVKGLKSLDSMKDKVSTELARCKIESNAIADRISFNLALLDDEVEFGFLFPDAAQIVLKAHDDFTALVNSRIAAHKEAEAAREEATRERIRGEEQAKAEREHAAKVESERIQREQVERAQAARIREEQAAATPIPAPVVNSAPITHEAVVAVMPSTVRAAMAPKPATAPTMTLGEISTRLGFNCTSAFLASLGFEATTVKAAKLFHADDFTAIGRAIIEHIESVCELQAA